MVHKIMSNDKFIQINKNARLMPEVILNALIEIPFFKNRLASEIEFSGSAQNAVYNSLDVKRRKGQWQVSDINNTVFQYTWDGAKWMRDFHWVVKDGAWAPKED